MFAKVFVAAAFVASAAAQTYSIYTPASLVQCQPAAITWTGGTSPFVLSALPAGQVSAAAIEYIATGLTSSPYTWTVNLATGLNITLRLSDANGVSVYASPLVIQTGPSSSCLNSSASTSGLSTVSASSNTAAVASGTASSVAGSSSSVSMTSRASSSSMASSSASSSASGAASGASSSGASLSSAAASASSVAASATSKSGAFPTAAAAIPALAAAAIGGVAALF